MKYFLIIIIVLIQLASCSDKTTKQKDSNTDTVSTTDQDSRIDGNYTAENEYELNYVVAVADGYDYDSLRKIALETSELLKFKFDTLDRYFNTTRKKIVLPDNYEDDIWAGEYYFRRFGDSAVSIEMRSAYIDTLTSKDENSSTKFYADTLKMFVFADMYNNKSQADSLLNILKPKFKQTTIIPTNIYMGCMH